MKNQESALSLTGESLEHRLIEQIQESELYQNYVLAFVRATGLPLRLAPVLGAPAASCGQYRANPFCGLLATQNRSREACFRCKKSLTSPADSDHQTSVCFAGLCESSVPIRTGERTIGFLLTGEIATEKPSPQRFATICRRLNEWGADFDEATLRRAYFSVPVISQKYYESILELLKIFAGHLSLVADQLILRNDSSGAADINRAREFITEHLTEPLDLKQVAGRANLSSCYFCKKFKESTGLTFTAYVARTRVEAAKKLLLNPQVRISEVAFEVGFQSLTHFNRVFKEISGQSPTQYRTTLPDIASLRNAHRVTRNS